jgi:MraZ protein
MFVNHYNHTLDSKNRLTIPSRYRELLAADGAFVMRGFDRNLMVIPVPIFEKIAARINQMSMTDPSVRALRRFIFTSAAQAEVDGAGRILIPEFLRQAAAIEAEVVVAGAGDYFEIFSPARWAEEMAKLEDPETVNQVIQALDLSTSA